MHFNLCMKMADNKRFIISIVLILWCLECVKVTYGTNMDKSSESSTITQPYVYNDIPIVYTTQDTVYGKLNAIATLECIVYAVPHARVSWLHNGFLVPLSNRLTHHENEVRTNHSTLHNNNARRHSLVIRKVSEFDYGFYQCQAENKIGTKSASIEVTGRPTPCIFKLNPELQGLTSLFIVWQTESYSPVIEYNLKFRQILPADKKHLHDNSITTEWTEFIIPSELSIGPIFTSSYNLHSLKPASKYEVIVLARNHYGWSYNSKSIRFSTGGEVEVSNLSTEQNLQSDDIQEDVFENIIHKAQVTLQNTNNGLIIYFRYKYFLILISCGIFQIWSNFKNF